MSTDPTTPRALTGLAPRRSLGVDPGLALLRRESRPAPARSTSDTQPAGVGQPTSGSTADAGRSVPPPTKSEETSVGAGRPAEPPKVVNRSADQLPAGEDLPRYLQLTRKESRIRSDQADRLAEHVRRLNRVRTHRNGSVGERITDNTLIRVAIDLLLARADELSGTTEDELRDSVSH